MSQHCFPEAQEFRCARPSAVNRCGTSALYAARMCRSLFFTLRAPPRSGRQATLNVMAPADQGPMLADPRAGTIG
jgi:hypothetical protein